MPKTIFLVIYRMLLVKEHFTTVIQELEYENLNVAQWKHLSSIESLLKPFAHQTNVTSSEKNTSVEGT